MTPPGSPELGDPALLGWRPVRGRRLSPVTLTARERFLVALFLRRYITWCARSGRQTQAQLAAELWRRIAA